MKNSDLSLADPFEPLQECLQKLIALHRQLLELNRQEHEALVQADLKLIQECAYSKQALIESVRQKESERRSLLVEISVLLKKPLSELTLSELTRSLQASSSAVDQKRSEQFQSSLNALTLLIARITEHHEQNRILVERSLTHLAEMKMNVLGEFMPKTDLYNQQGTRSNAHCVPRLISREV